MKFEIGQTIGDYQILSVLGRGGMGAVYKVRNTLTDREEAMKVVLPDTGSETADRFLREIRIQASLQHPHIAAIRTAFRSDESVLMIMELIEGVPLDRKLREGSLTRGETFRIVDDILSALAHAHAKGIVHRDIKPSNIIVTPRGAPKLTDFGIATATGDQRLTRSGVALGSLAYMSPEQVKSQPFDERADIYSLGITAYEALTGSRPFRSDNEYEIMRAHVHEAPVSPGVRDPSLPPAISAVVLKSLEKAPEDRYQTAKEFQEAWRQAFFGGSEAETMILPQPPPDPKIEPKVEPKIEPKMDPRDLARIEAELTRALGPIAKSLVARAAARDQTVEALTRNLAEQIPGAEDRASFLKACGVGAGLTTGSGSFQKASTLDEKMLETARKALAPSLGPIAAMVVSRTAKRVHSAEELRDALAAEIPDQKDRKKFLDAFPAAKQNH
jgi:serine/threonine-protein kinase